MRIGLVTTEYPPFPVGGIATANASMVRNVAAAGHEVHVFTNAAPPGSPAPEDPLPSRNERGVFVHRLPLFDQSWAVNHDLRIAGANPFTQGELSRHYLVDCSSLAAIAFAEKVAALHAEAAFDVVESPDCMASAFCLLRRRLSGEALPPVCIVGHGDSRDMHMSSDDAFRLGYPGIRLRMVEEEACLRHADALQIPSRYMLDRYRRRFGNRLPEIVEVIPYYLDVPSQPRLSPEAVGAGRFALALGRLEPRKGTDLVLRAFAVLARRFPDLRLVLCGAASDWREGQSLEQMFAACLPADLSARVIRLGRRSREEVFALARAAAVVLHAARFEVYPNVVLETMAAGGVVVASRDGGQVEMIEHERSGLLVAGEQVDELADAATRVIADEDLAVCLRAAAARRAVELTDAPMLTARRERLYAAIARSRAVPRDPGPGLVVIDAQRASRARIERTLADVRPQVPGWRIVVLADAGALGPIHGAHVLDVAGEVPWPRAAPTALPVVWVQAGVTLLPGAIGAMLALAAAVPTSAAVLPWIQCAATTPFPYRFDTTLRDLLLEGTGVPPAFLARAGSLREQRDFHGLEQPDERLVALLALCIAVGPECALHIPRVVGYSDSPPVLVTEDCRRRSVGNLERHHRAGAPWTSRATVGLVRS